jgi:hypothetical protein
MKKQTMVYVLIAGLQSSTGERKNRLTTTATTTDNEGNSESVHRSRRRSRQPVSAVVRRGLSEWARGRNEAVA